MKVLLLNGSPNKNGCTFTALSEAAKALNGCGTETEIFQIGKKPVPGCIACGSCVNQCPFGAIQDKSYITDAIHMIMGAEHWGYKTYAIIAPSIAGQFAPRFLRSGCHRPEEAGLQRRG